MKSQMILGLLLSLCITTACNQIISKEIETETIEEQPVNTTVVNLLQTDVMQDILNSPQRNENIRFNLLGGSRYFSVTQQTGVIKTTSVIDRETVCSPSKEICEMKLDVMCVMSSSYNILKIKVTIVDLDDNLPVFSIRTKDILITEGDNLNVTKSLPAAYDRDSELNTDTVYRISSISPNLNGFTLHWTTTELFLTFAGNMDAEVTQSYDIKISASSLTHSDSFSELSVTVTVSDVNDNKPVFDQDEYRVSVSESTAVNATIIKVKAIDSDVSPEYNRLLYKLDERGSSEYFSINSVTGELTLIASLDYEMQPSHSLLVIAYDGSYPLISGDTVVHIAVIDDNDNSPQINVGTTNPGNLLMVEEHAAEGTFIAHLSVTDADKTSPNNDIVCEISSDSYFELDLIYDREYSLLVKEEIDRELLGDRLIVDVMCTDLGSPAKTSSNTLEVTVVDINDNSPEFTETEYHVYHLKENDKTGSHVLVESAIDRDSGDNSRVTYSLSLDASGSFTTDSDTGSITALVSLDYEQQSEYHFYIYAADLGSPSLTATAQVYVHLVDVNDNRPLFDQPEYRFSVVEGHLSDGNSMIGQVKATDADKQGKSEVQYVIPDAGNYFSIDGKTGAIISLTSLDREKTSSYQLEVVATDLGTPALSSTVSVYIQVLDINDNWPQFTTTPNTTYTITYKLPEGEIIAHLPAQDPDSLDHTKLVYSLVSDGDLFAIEKTTGALYVNQALAASSKRNYKLTVTVTDTADHSNSIGIFVQIVEPLEDKSTMIATLIGCSVGVLLIVIGILVAVFFKIRQSRHTKYTYNCRLAAESRLNSSRSCDYYTHRTDIISRPTDLSIETSTDSNKLTSLGVHGNSYKTISKTENDPISSSCSILTDSGCCSLSTTPHLISPQNNECNTYSQPLKCPLVPYDVTIVSESGSTSMNITNALDDSDVFNTEDLCSHDYKSNYCNVCRDDSVISWSHVHSFNDGSLSRTEPMGLVSLV